MANIDEELLKEIYKFIDNDKSIEHPYKKYAPLLYDGLICDNKSKSDDKKTLSYLSKYFKI